MEPAFAARQIRQIIIILLGDRKSWLIFMKSEIGNGI